MEEKQIKIHYGELSTKGKNRKMFQQKMAEQIRHKTKYIERIKIYPNRDFMFMFKDGRDKRDDNKQTLY